MTEFRFKKSLHQRFPRVRGLTFFATGIIALVTSGCTNQAPETEAQSDTTVALQKMEQQLQEIASRLQQIAGDEQELRGQLTVFKATIVEASGEELTSLETEIDAFRKSLPAIAAIELADELAAIDWLIGIKRSLGGTPTVEKAEAATLLLEEVPAVIPADVAERLSEDAADTLMQTAELVLNADDQQSEDVAALVAMITELRFEGDSESQPTELADLVSKLKKKQEQLRSNEAIAAVNQELADLRESFTSLGKLNDPELQELVLLELRRSLQLLSLRVAGLDPGQEPAEPAELAQFQSDVNEQLRELVRQENSKQQTKQSQARLKYQDWALAEIQRAGDLLDNEKLEKKLNNWVEAAEASKQFEFRWADFDGTRSLMEKAVGKIPDSLMLTGSMLPKFADAADEQWYEILRQVKHDAARRHLLHIDPALLDPPVARFYRDAIDLTWQAIDDDPDLKLSLAKSSALIPRHSLSEFIED